MKRKVISIILILGSLKIYSQSNNDSFYYFKNFPNSPSTATFLRYGDIQNSEFTGTNAPKISLYDIQNGDIKIPLTIDYISGNGIKVADEASSVGLGWNIGLPVIVQSVLGEDDFNPAIQKLKIDLHHQNAPWPALNYSGKYMESKEGPEPAGFVDPPKIGKYSYYYSIYHTLPVNGQFKSYPNWVRYDSSPDIFSLNLFGEKISFFISNHKNLNTSPPEFTCLKAGYIVAFDNSLSTFRVTAPNGNIYKFEKNEEIKFNEIINRNYVLTQVKDKNNKIVNIEYDQYNNIRNFIPNSKNLNYNKEVTVNSTYCEGIPLYYAGNYVSSTKLNGVSGQSELFFQTGSPGTYLVPDSPYFNSIQNYLLVSKISGDFGTLNFTYSSREDFPTAKLSKIILKNNTGIEVKNIDFEYNYSTSNDNSPYQSAPPNLYSDDRLKKRLFLKALRINGIENYTFSYKSEASLPRKDSYAVDYWGYYNGGTNNQSYFLNPTDLTNSLLPVTSLNNNKKIADINYITAGLLDRINYPTQGYSIFNYELNTADNLFSNYNPSSLTSGKGVRLESQSNYDSQGSFVEKSKFLYEEGYSTNPLDLITEYNTKFIQANSNQIISTQVVSMNSTNNYSSSPLSSGDFVGYKKVTKIQVDNSGGEKGKITSTYNINPDSFYRFSFNQLQVSIPRTKSEGTENGMLLSQDYFDNNNQVLKRVVNEYDTKYSNIYYGTVFNPINEYLFICGNIPSGPTADFGSRLLSVAAHYPLFSKESLLLNSTTTDYLNGKELSTKTSYTYDNSNLLSSKTIRTPELNEVLEEYPNSSQIPRFLNVNILSESIGKNIYNNGKKIFGQSIKYDDTSHYNPTSVTTTDLFNNTSSNEVIYDIYNQDKLLQYTTKGGIPVTIIWGYNATQPIAKIEGGTYSQIMQAFSLNGSNNNSYKELDIVKKSDLDIDDATEQNLLSAFDTFRNKSEFQNFKISTYTFDPLIGIKSITQPSGFKEFYEYDTVNRLKRILNTKKEVVKEFNYNYSPLKYYNTQKSQTFTRNNCGTMGIGGSYTYTVSANKYSSTLSQADADQMAQNDINTNGQNAANSNATCTSINCNITVGSGMNSLYYSSIQIDESPNKYKIQMGFSLEQGKPWKTTGVVVGKINGNCRPSVTTNSSCYYQGIWAITMNPNGDIIAKKIDGSDNYGSTMNLSFTLLMN